MPAWQPGDPIGQIGPNGYQLPDKKTAASYAAECLRQIIEAYASQVCACQDLEQRRRMIASYAAKSKNKIRMQNLLKTEVLRQWQTRAHQ